MCHQSSSLIGFGYIKPQSQQAILPISHSIYNPPLPTGCLSYLSRAALWMLTYWGFKGTQYIEMSEMCVFTFCCLKVMRSHGCEYEHLVCPWWVCVRARTVWASNVGCVSIHDRNVFCQMFKWFKILVLFYYFLRFFFFMFWSQRCSRFDWSYTCRVMLI